MPNKLRIISIAGLMLLPLDFLRYVLVLEVAMNPYLFVRIAHNLTHDKYENRGYS